MFKPVPWPDDEYKYELIDGELVAMSPRPRSNHLTISGNISYIFQDYLKKKKKPCKVYQEKEVFLSDKNHFIPDISIVCNRFIDKEDGIHGAPDLAVEVLSPSTFKKDRGRKKDVYEQSGVKEFWIVSPKECTIEVYLLEDGKFRLDETYFSYSEEDFGKLRDDEKSKIIPEFKTSLFDDLTIIVDDVFDGIDEYWGG